MTKARKYQVSVEDTPYYHVTRRSFLCGKDKFTGKCYEHRRQWVEDRIRLLSTVYSIDILSFSVMSNHLHIAVKLAPSQIDILRRCDKIT